MADEYTHKLEEAVRAIVEAIRASRPVNLNIATPAKRDYAEEALARARADAAAAVLYGKGEKSGQGNDYRVSLASGKDVLINAKEYIVEQSGGLWLPGIAYFAPGAWVSIVRY